MVLLDDDLELVEDWIEWLEDPSAGFLLDFFLQNCNLTFFCLLPFEHALRFIDSNAAACDNT